LTKTEPPTPAGGRVGGLLGEEGRTALGNVLVKALSVPVEKACRILLMVVAAPILGAAYGEPPLQRLDEFI